MTPYWMNLSMCVEWSLEVVSQDLKKIVPRNWIALFCAVTKIELSSLDERS